MHLLQPVSKRTNYLERYANKLELALGNLQDKVVLLCSTLREEEEHEEDITKSGNNSGQEVLSYLKK